MNRRGKDSDRLLNGDTLFIDINKIRSYIINNSAVI